jgi:hypothetical protein
MAAAQSGVTAIFSGDMIAAGHFLSFKKTGRVKCEG